jgi:hypothetical protein
MEANAKKIRSGDMSLIETSLNTQARVLETLFNHRAIVANGNMGNKNFEMLLRMSLKAQNQSRMTYETLAAIKRPPAIVAHQTNIAHGPQQVNGVKTPPQQMSIGAENFKIVQNELLEKTNGNRLVRTAPLQSVAKNTKREAVEVSNRPENTSWQGAKLS